MSLGLSPRRLARPWGSPRTDPACVRSRGPGLLELVCCHFWDSRSVLCTWAGGTAPVCVGSTSWRVGTGNGQGEPRPVPPFWPPSQAASDGWHFRRREAEHFPGRTPEAGVVPCRCWSGASVCLSPCFCGWEGWRLRNVDWLRPGMGFQPCAWCAGGPGVCSSSPLGLRVSHAVVSLLALAAHTGVSAACSDHFRRCPASPGARVGGWKSGGRDER